MVAVLGEIAASGGYIAAVAADHVIARGNTLTGSIGVILEYPNFSDLLDEIGVEIETIRSSNLKGGTSPLRDASPEERALEEALVEDSYQWFRGLVSERRNLSGGALDRVANGRVFTGRLALSAELIDEIGGMDAAEAWLEETDGEPRRPSQATDRAAARTARHPRHPAPRHCPGEHPCHREARKRAPADVHAALTRATH